MDHIIAEKHGGPTVESNLALACPHCNRFKGPNIAGLDPESGQPIRLFHPRTDSWSEHFEFEGARIVGRTPTGNASVHVLAMNADDLLLIPAASGIKGEHCNPGELRRLLTFRRVGPPKARVPFPDTYAVPSCCR
jgi:hypothetical protein